MRLALRAGNLPDPREPIRWDPKGQSDIIGITMATTPLRDLPDDVMQHYTDLARREGVSRNTLLVRVLTDAARRDQRPPLTPAALERSAARTRDLTDAEIMSDAWS